MQPEYKDAVNRCDTSVRVVGPRAHISRTKDRFFSDQVFNSFDDAPWKRLLPTLENLGSGARCGHLPYISFQKLRTHTHGKYTQNWIISRSRNFTFFFVFFKFYQFSQLQIVKLFVFQTWILFLSIFFFFFLHNRTTLPQLLIHLPATKIGLGVIILPGYKVK